jgi:hypothetical protein
MARLLRAGKEEREFVAALARRFPDVTPVEFLDRLSGCGRAGQEAARCERQSPPIEPRAPDRGD